ncbi:phosphatidate cytidylyltransferase [Miltoncostaea marina]|uniref:phosphatidate cytidylyltransferase n=1 Tax=Miltoncostaea marina TaxID=2843215 RepID=UPI001C3DB9E4|nr:phosphatidate cytidylyltransferase [Miltoncostaea marina]
MAADPPAPAGGTAGGSNLAARVAVAIPGIAVAVGLVWLGGLAFAVALAVVAALGLYELYSLTAAARPLRWAGYLGTIATVLLAWGVEDTERGIVLGLAVSLLLTAIAGLILARREDITARMASTLLGSVYLGLPFALLVAMRDLPHGAEAIVNVLVGVWVFDSASYFGGRLWGTRPIAPLTSPKKTVEGAVVGLVTATLAVWVAGLYMDWIGGWDSLVLGLAICPAAFLGDLFESMLKRDVGAKDSGRLLLAHGGVLDRFDALLFGAVAAYFATIWLVY